MKHKIFVIHDVKANCYMEPWFLQQQAIAQRAFSDCVNDPDHNFGRHPEDYTLFNIGEYNDQNAKIEWIPPQSLGNGIEYLKPELADNQKDLFKTQGLSETTNDSHQTKPNS